MSLHPAYGGPAVSVSRLATALSKIGIDAGVWAPDQSAATTPYLEPGSAVRRLTGSESEALKSFGEVDVIHDNGVWRPHNHRLAVLAARRGIPRAVSTRGMLEPWAMRQKPWKKAIAWRLYQQRDLQQAQRHHATAEAEAEQLRRLGLTVPVCVIPNGVDLPDFDGGERAAGRSAAGSARKVLFLSRIHPKKGLLMLIEAWSQVRPAGWLLEIAGPDEGGHRSEVGAAVSAAQLDDEVSFVGALEGEAKAAAFYGADFFILPTFSENFGLVVAEALAHGLPVVTTTGAPWSVLHERRCGWWVEPTVSGVSDGLRKATSCAPEVLESMGRKGRELVFAEFGWPRVAKDFATMYEGIAR